MAAYCRRLPVACRPSIPRWRSVAQGYMFPTRCADRGALIAATALVHGMTVVTRYSADFKPTSV